MSSYIIINFFLIYLNSDLYICNTYSQIIDYPYYSRPKTGFITSIFMYIEFYILYRVNREQNYPDCDLKFCPV